MGSPVSRFGIETRDGAFSLRDAAVRASWNFSLHRSNRDRGAMNMLRLLMLVFLWAFPLRVFAQGQKPQQQPEAEPIRVSVDRVNVGVIVTDAQGQFVEGLRREEFHVFDDGAEQPITAFSAIEEPAQVFLLIEAGPAVYLLEGGHIRAAESLLRGLAPGDRVAIVKYAEAPEAVLDFTADKQAAANALEELRFNLGFGSLNLSSSLGTALDWLSRMQGKKTIVLLSTGVDTSSSSAWESILRRLKVSDVRLLAISLSGNLRTAETPAKKKAPPQKPSATAQEFAEADETLRQLAEATGGRAYFPKSAADFHAVYSQIAQLVRHEYSLAFAPPARDAAVHSIDVRVDSAANASAYRIDHRQGYAAPAPEKP
jgi:Ca-activated chloride channel homolog